jgi:hypothetical protein
MNPGGPHVQSGYGAQQPYGRIEINAGFFPLSWILYFVNPVVWINGQRHQARWGRNSFDLPPGQYDVRICFAYMWTDSAGLAQAMLPVHPGYVTVVRYEAPFFVTTAGSMRVTGQLPTQTHQLRA